MAQKKLDPTALAETSMPFLYRDNFVQDLDQKITSLPKGRWVSLKNRRLQEWGARSLPNGTQAIGEDLPDWLQALSIKIRNEFPDVVPTFNQCLINEYEVGQGIMPHEDGPCYDPVIATISLGCYTVLDMYPKGCHNSLPEFSLLLEPGSCLILTGEYYTDYLHGIQETSTDNIPIAKISNIAPNKSVGSTISRSRTSTRVSLTFRKHNNVKTFKFLRL